MRNNTKTNKRLKSFSIFTLLILTAVVVISLLFGLHWHGTISGIIPPKKLVCREHNDLWETFQVECYSPLKKKQKNFIFSGLLKCSLLTNHQLSDVNEKYQLDSPTKYSRISLIKTDYRVFTLKLDNKKNEIRKSLEPGEPSKPSYTIIQNDDKVINALRKNKFDDFFGYTYEYLTVSKKTGKGVATWVNTDDYSPDQDSMVSEFFQCENLN